MKRFAPWAAIPALIIALITLAAGCAGGAETIRRDAGTVHELVLLHTNDHHGAILPTGGQGGLAERATFIKSVRAEHANVLLVDAGDLNTGPALSNMFDAKPDIRAYNLMGYQAVTFGNHEFDGSPDKLTAQLARAAFPFVSSNIKTADGAFLGGRQYIVKNYGGFRVGIFGITTLRTTIIASPDRSLTFIPEIKAARAAVALLRKREKVDIVIGLTHMGDVKEAAAHVTSLELAAAVPGIDIIVDGHSHSFFASPRRAGGAWIVSANEWGKYVGKGIITIVDGKMTGFDWTPVEINREGQKTYAPDAAVSAMLAPFIEQAAASLKETVGRSAEPFVFGNRLTRYGETALGNLITDANVWYFDSVYGQRIDFAFHNGGTIRAELAAGPITREQILTMLPFDNYLFVVSLTGAELIELFDFIAAVPQGAGGFPQFSKEVRYTLDVPAQAVRDLTIGGKPVDPKRTYRFCTNDYLVSGGDGYEVLKKSKEPFNTSLALSWVVTEFIKAQEGALRPETDGRMRVMGGVTP
jgi:5'-nucleotidase/UDP-sugar diphosphatase